MPPRRTRYIIFVPQESLEGLATALGSFWFFGYGIAIITAPIWVPILGLIKVAQTFQKQAAELGFMIPIGTAISTVLFTLFLVIFLVTFFIGLFRRELRLIKKSFISWLLSLLILSVIGNWLGSLPAHSDSSSQAYAASKQSLDSQIGLILLENKYRLNLKPKERQEILERSNIFEYLDDELELEKKYNLQPSFQERISIIDSSRNNAEKSVEKRIPCNGSRDTGISNCYRTVQNPSEIVPDYIEFEIISRIAEIKAESRTKMTSEELSIGFPPRLNRKLFLPQYSRLKTIELTHLWKTQLSDQQRNRLKGNYCTQIVNSVFWAYRVDAGYIPAKDDSRLLKLEANNPKTSPDFLDCHRFILKSGYRFSDWGFYKANN